MLYGAVASGDVAHVAQLVRSGVSVNVKFQPNFSILVSKISKFDLPQ